jgi:hypothetical protein
MHITTCSTESRVDTTATKGTQGQGAAPVSLSTPFPHPSRLRKWIVPDCSRPY